MNMLRYVLSVAWKEAQLLIRDRSALFSLFLLPVLLGSLIAAPNIMFAGDEAEAAIQLNVALVNQDAGGFGTEVSKAIYGIEQLQVDAFNTVAEAEGRVARGEATAAIVIPAGFSEKVDAHTPTAIEVIVDPAEPESSSIVSGIMNQVVAEVTIWGEVQYGVRAVLDRSGLLEGATAQQRKAIEAQNLGVIMTRLNEMRRDPLIAVMSENLSGVEAEGSWVTKYLAYVFPGFTVMFIFFIVELCAGSLLEERETGVLRRLAAAPIPRAAVLAGKMLAYLVLASLQAALLFGLARIAFGMPLGNSPLGLLVVTLVAGMVATALGLLVAALAKTSKQATNIGNVLGFVLAGISGAIPIHPQAMFFRAGGVVGFLARLTPHAHAVEAYYRLMAEGAPFVRVLPQVGILLLMGAVFYAIAVARFKFEA